MPAPIDRLSASFPTDFCKLQYVPKFVLAMYNEGVVLVRSGGSVLDYYLNSYTDLPFDLLHPYCQDGSTGAPHYKPPLVPLAKSEAGQITRDVIFTAKAYFETVHISNLRNGEF